MSTDLTFDQAVSRFRAFLSAEGWPTAIRWVEAADVARSGQGRVFIARFRDNHERQAEKEYEVARHRRLGICFDAVCTVGETTCAMVLSPADALDAELQMYPCDGGLKLSVAMREPRAGRPESGPQV
jgi:hypothetical protein